MTDNRVYLQDQDGYEFEVDLDFTDTVGLYLEGPQIGEEFTLSYDQEAKAYEKAKENAEI
jgi:hypothetical protein